MSAMARSSAFRLADGAKDIVYFIYAYMPMFSCCLRHCHASPLIIAMLCHCCRCFAAAAAAA